MSIREQVGTLAFIAAIIIAIVSASAFYCVQQLTDSHESVYNSATTLEATQELCFHLAYASASQRAYIITDKDSLLELYHRELDLTKQMISRLKALVQNNPDEHVLAEKIDRSAMDRLASLEATLQIYESKGQAAAFERIKDGIGLAVMSHTLQLTNELNDYELKQLVQRKSVAEFKAKTTSMTILLGSLLAISIVIISYLYLAHNLTSVVSNLLRASQNIARDRFEPLVNVNSNNELGDIGRAFNTLAGHLKDRSDELEAAKSQLSAVEQELRRQSGDFGSLQSLVEELHLFVGRSVIEFGLAANHMKSLEAELHDCGSLADLSGSTLRQLLEFGRQIRVSAESVDRKCMDLNDGLTQLSDQSDQVWAAIESIWDGLPSTKDFLSQLDTIDSELSVLDVVATMGDAKSDANPQQQVSAIKKHLKQLRQSLASARSNLNINVSHMQQKAREALDASSRFNSSLKGTRRPFDSIAEEMKQLLQSTLSSRNELINLDRLCQRNVSSLETLGKLLSLLGMSLAKDQDFAAKIKHRVATLTVDVPSEPSAEADDLQEATEN